jgi:hypothetical protein
VGPFDPSAANDPPSAHRAVTANVLRTANSPWTSAEPRARWANRLFVTVGVLAAGLLLVVGFVVLAVSAGNPVRTTPLAGASSLAANGHRATPGRDGDRESRRLARQSPTVKPSDGRRNSAGRRRRAGHRARARRHNPPGPAASRAIRPIAAFDGSGDMVTSQFAVGADADWQIEWSYRCPAGLPAGMLVVENDAPSAVGTAISTSGTGGRGDTWLDPDGRSHRLVVISNCSWTMKVIQNS